MFVRKQQIFFFSSSSFSLSFRILDAGMRMSKWQKEETFFFVPSPFTLISASASFFPKSKNSYLHILLIKRIIHFIVYVTSPVKFWTQKHCFNTVVLALSKCLKGWMQEIPLKFREVKYKVSRGRTLVSIRGDPERMFLILIPKLGVQDSRFSYSTSNSLISKWVRRGWYGWKGYDRRVLMTVSHEWDREEIQHNQHANYQQENSKMHQRKYIVLNDALCQVFLSKKNQLSHRSDRRNLT